MSIKAGDLLVEYRDKNLNRRGAIPIEDLSLRLQPVLNGVGSWSLKLPTEHRAVPYLRAPGSGIIITNIKTGQTVMSGLTSKPSKNSTSQDISGLTTIAGLSDDALLWHALCYPDPTNSDVATQDESHDIFSGDAESAMRHYVAANVGSAAPLVRRQDSFREFITLQAVNKHLGGAVIKSARFDKLGDMLAEIASTSGLRFRLVQVGSALELQIEEIADKRKFIRLDVANGTLQEQSVLFAPPTVTRVVVAGQGNGVDRQFLMRTSAESLEAEDEWGLIIEDFKDQRNTSDVAELQQSGDEILADGGFTTVAVKASPSDDQTMVFQIDFNLGDRITIVVDDQEADSYVTEAAIVADESGVITAVAIGDVQDFDKDSALRKTVLDTERRVSNLERNEAASDAVVNADGGKPDSVYNGLPTLDGGGI